MSPMQLEQNSPSTGQYWAEISDRINRWLRAKFSMIMHLDSEGKEAILSWRIARYSCRKDCPLKLQMNTMKHLVIFSKLLDSQMLPTKQMFSKTQVISSVRRGVWSALYMDSEQASKIELRDSLARDASCWTYRDFCITNNVFLRMAGLVMASVLSFPISFSSYCQMQGFEEEPLLTIEEKIQVILGIESRRHDSMIQESTYTASSSSSYWVEVLRSQMNLRSSVVRASSRQATLQHMMRKSSPVDRNLLVGLKSSSALSNYSKSSSTSQDRVRDNASVSSRNSGISGRTHLLMTILHTSTKAF